MTTSSEWDRFCDAIDEVLAAGEATSRAEAGALVRRRHPELAGVRAPQPQVQSQRGTSVGSAEAQLDALARQLQRERRCTYAEGFCAALNSEPRLYLEYLHQQRDRLAAQAARRD